MDAAGSKVYLNFALGLQVFGIKRDFVILLFALGLNQERIVEILIVQVKGGLVEPSSIRLDDLPIGNLGVFHEDVDIGHALTVSAAHEPFDGEPMIGFMRGRACRWSADTQTQR